MGSDGSPGGVWLTRACHAATHGSLNGCVCANPYGCMAAYHNRHIYAHLQPRGNSKTCVHAIAYSYFHIHSHPGSAILNPPGFHPEH